MATVAGSVNLIAGLIPLATQAPLGGQDTQVRAGRQADRFACWSTQRRRAGRWCAAMES